VHRQCQSRYIHLSEIEWSEEMLEPGVLVKCIFAGYCEYLIIDLHQWLSGIALLAAAACRALRALLLGWRRGSMQAGRSKGAQQQHHAVRVSTLATRIRCTEKIDGQVLGCT